MSDSYNQFIQCILITLIVISLVFLINGCDSNPKEPDIPPEVLPELPISERDFQVGIAGIIPRNYPNSTEEDYLLFTEEAKLVAEYVGPYAPWDDPGVTEGIEFVQYHVADVKPLIALGFNMDSVEVGYFERVRDSYREAVLEVVSDYQPEYIAVGVEVNRLIVEKSRDIFDEYVETYLHIYDAIREIDTQTKIFATFQLEYMKGAAYLTGMEFEPHWDALESFDEKLDLVGLTVYPFLEYSTVSEIPDGYYQEINQYIDKPVIIAEMGWLSQDVLTVEGSEQEQVDFVVDFLEASEDLNMELMMYSFLYEPIGVEPLFSSIALKTNDGEEKEVYSYWRALKELTMN
ncbi:MAG: hypothetical protein GF315_00155 [candidate division Zixibacteria bacterium]|nr:hypothetical protein [candidate division Zixibacteria bacterium]